ncbi:hypothetical protein MOQ_007124, partial [Trypanosoma cruzi marinkellei]
KKKKEGGVTMLPEKKVSFYHKAASTKDRGPTVTIPNIPKVLDERARMRLLCDYEKYEPELLKHHIGTPETTQTIGLKFVPTEFDRRLPSSSELTIAEREYEARRRNRKANKRISFASPASKQLVKRGAADSPLAPAAARGKARTTPVPPSASLSASVPPPEHVLPPRQHRGRLSHTSWVAVTRTPSLSPSSPMPPFSPTEPQSQEASPGRSTAATGLSSRKLSVHLMREASQRSPLEKGEMVKSMTPQKQLYPPSSVKSGSTTSPIGGGGGGALFSPKNVGVLNAELCGKLLRVLLSTPPEYSESFHLDLHNIDLRWMHGARYPNLFVTLHTWHSSEIGASAPSINSPRSAIVLLQNGIEVNDLIPPTSIQEDAFLPKDPEMRQMVKSMRAKRRRRYCEELLESMHQKYMELCRSVKLADIVKAFHEDTKREALVELPTSLKKDHERRQRALLTERKRLEKQVGFARDVHERQLIAEERQRQVEEEMRAKMEAKKEEERIAHERAAERMALQRQKISELEAFYQKRIEERQARAAEKNARRLEAQQRQIEQRQEERQRLAEERQQRFERVAELQEQQKLLIRKKHEAKEEKLQLLQEEQRRRQEELHAKILERAAKSEELRELARQRAEMHEEKVRQAAEEQQRKVEERLSRFYQSCKDARAQRALQEERKRIRMTEALNIAANKINFFKEAAALKQLEHEKLFAELQRQREAEILTRSEREHEEMEAKSFAVTRSKRMTEFGKLQAVLQLLSKREAALALEKERALLLQETRKAREAMLTERRALKEEIARQTKTMQP